MNWKKFRAEIQALPAGTNRLRPGCTENKIAKIEKDAGPLPNELREMLKAFSGGASFCGPMPMITFFGGEHPSGKSTPEWPSSCWMSVQIRSWHESGGIGWPFARSCYGGVLVLRLDNVVQEHGDADPLVSDSSLPLSDWADRILILGGEHLKGNLS